MVGCDGDVRVAGGALGRASVDPAGSNPLILQKTSRTLGLLAFTSKESAGLTTADGPQPSAGWTVK